MGNAWSKHVGKWYASNSGKNGINSLKDAMRSAKCKADFRAKSGGPTMKTEKNVMNMKKGKKGTRKMKGGSSLSPANFASEPVQTGKVDTPVVKGGKKGSSLKNVLKSIESSLKKLKGGASGIGNFVIVGMNLTGGTASDIKVGRGNDSAEAITDYNSKAGAVTGAATGAASAPTSQSPEFATAETAITAIANMLDGKTAKKDVIESDYNNLLRSANDAIAKVSNTTEKPDATKLLKTQTDIYDNLS